MRRSKKREPGSFYSRALEVINAADPLGDEGMQRQQARELMAAAYEARVRLAPIEDTGRGASYPRTAKELRELKDDFKAGEIAREITRQTSTPPTASGHYIEVMEVRGIVRLRRGGDPSATEIYLTKPEWQIFLKDLERESPASALEGLHLEPSSELIEDLAQDEVVGVLQAFV
jgi:hypothetical protein